ncbi:Hypp3532 [Branchiostoma lanceolatum]|uniref:Hypp3532 protein n=1 Tax=Branchiostoma lanceolatum TaxID=7740 RepID=A0A8K0EXZ0_BRALA|nr:Hypp3532 [Branchiostoma lanceolatum]
MTRFQTMRTNYFKLKRKVAGKSGQGQTKLTPLQDFNLRRSWTHTTVPQPQSSSDEADDEARTSAVTGSSDRSGHDGSWSPPKKKKKGMTEVLVDLLTDSQKELRQSQATLAEKWRAYQKDTFAVAMRYTTGEEQQPPQPPTPVFQPVQQHQVVQHQPAQYMAVPFGFGAPGQQHLRPPLVSATPPTTTVSPLRAETVTLQNAGQEGSDKGASAED